MGDLLFNGESSHSLHTYRMWAVGVCAVSVNLLRNRVGDISIFIFLNEHMEAQKTLMTCPASPVTEREFEASKTQAHNSKKRGTAERLGLGRVQSAFAVRLDL